MNDEGWVRGDYFALDMPADADALRNGGAQFLSAAFRATGALPSGSAVTAVTELTEFRGGSTGRKALLSVAYDGADLPTDLFAKFSRDFDDAGRDHGREQMEFEVRFALMSRTPSFPIVVPTCLFADYHAPSGTGLLITDRIPYGESGIEPHYAKCMDYAMHDPVGHYEALLGTLGRLAGTHKSGHLPAELINQFPVDMKRLSVGERVPYSVAQLQRRVDRFAELATAQPGLLPANLRSPDFISRLRLEVVRFGEDENAIWDWLSADPDYVALCHWNANVDNAWFWRRDGDLECGLMDWGCAGQMNVAMAIWGAMCSAETELWDDHLDGLLDVFVKEFTAAGGPALTSAVVKQHLMLYAAIMGLAWLLDVPSYLLRLLPDRVEDRFDPQIADNEQARSRLLMMTNFLNLWETSDFVGALDAVTR
ncbi:hypothetical protein AB4Z42_01665 [Mycobacterium sp. 2YAF39]|uniref:hypothetical protein n=1 Tax=Mycobacterium sp. 2YAF39 TaxID=3233033 RepID=UPI003F980BA3